VTVGGGAVWFACEAADLGRIDTRTGAARRVGLEAGILTSPNAVLPIFSDIVYGLERLWIVNRAANAVIEIDTTTIQRQRDITVGNAPSAIAVSADSLWVTNFEDDTVTRIVITAPGQTPTLTTIPVGDGPVDVAFGEGGVWVVSQLDRAVTRIDPESGDVTAAIRIGNEPLRVAAGEGAVWVTVRAPETEEEDG